MNSTTFEKRVKQYESILNKHIGNKTTWIENDWFLIEPLNENDSEISIRFLFDEIRVGIGMVTESYSDKYTGLEFEKGFEKFLKLISTKIKREDFYKGKYPYKSHYAFENNRVYELFGTAMTWEILFWKKLIKKTNIQNPIIESELIMEKLIGIK
ncbi:hypothetical protein ACU8DI_14785 [Psychroserpens sp. BH13MA-6]